MTTTDHAALPGGGSPGGRPGTSKGLRPATAAPQPPAGSRLPAAARERKPALAALAVLLILGGALLSTSLVLSSGDTVSAVGLAKDVQPGERITSSDLTELKVPKNGGPEYEEWTELKVAGITEAYARVPLIAGSLLHARQTVPNDFLTPGRVRVGLTLSPGQFPAELSTGDRVTAYLAGSSDSGSGATRGVQLVDRAWVDTVSSGKDDDDRLATGDDLQVTLVVEEQDAAKLTPAAARGDVALVLLPPSGQ